MKKLYILWILIIVLTSCKDDDINVFEETADERVAAAIQSLKDDLAAPANGWRLKYRPEDGGGSFYVLLKFDDENKVNIKTDLGSQDGEFYEQNLTYRIDSSLGLELIIENYSFFSFLFEQDQATYGAEFEFNYANKTPEGDLVFVSKTDLSNPTTLVFEEASATDANLLGKELSGNLNDMSDDLAIFSSSFKLTFETRDLLLFLALNESKRTIDIGSAAKKSNTASIQSIDFVSGYTIKGDSLILDTPLAGSFAGTSISLKSIAFSSFTNESIDICVDPITTHAYTGVTNANLPVTLETTLQNATGKLFATESDFYYAPLSFIIDNGVSAASAIQQDIQGAVEMDLFYNTQLNDGSRLYGLGFTIINSDNSQTFAYRKFTPVLEDNKITFNFDSQISTLGNPVTDADISKIDIYLDKLTEGDNTFVFKLITDRYEFNNPCTGWSFVFINAN
ncbi:DUF4302 domain-containing protein [Ohtaekwangia koreensis]|uniref:DUF4302 domain-containing protein n=1 Tax=Ohtaekwangia koreensis TaxID=688867 RepID=A0A1T5K532_9BACT|nr:DUF4302 domain-containing protein [Ohtaekwangia koreensis]SKC58731.1 protein of unknown function [Ohtaekwangia koreensis]